jgi:hypothetical protein
MKLAELQARFGQALLQGEFAPLTSWLCEEANPPEERLGIYREAVFASLTEVLGETFIAVSRLLGKESFRCTVETFVQAHPPTQPCLADYGDCFAGFLERSAAARGRPGLPDLARQEWLAHRAAHDPELGR